MLAGGKKGAEAAAGGEAGPEAPVPPPAAAGALGSSSDSGGASERTPRKKEPPRASPPGGVSEPSAVGATPAPGAETTGIAETPEGRRTSRRKRAKVGVGRSGCRPRWRLVRDVLGPAGPGPARGSSSSGRPGPRPCGAWGSAWDRALPKGAGSMPGSGGLRCRECKGQTLGRPGSPIALKSRFPVVLAHLRGLWGGLVPCRKGEVSAAVQELLAVPDRLPSSKNTPNPWQCIGALMSLHFIIKFVCYCDIWMQPLEAHVHEMMLVLQDCEGCGHAQSSVPHLPSIGIGELSQGCVRVRFSNEI